MKENNQASNPPSNLILDKQICFSLYSASNAMIRAYRPLLKELELTYLQYIVMMVLWQYSTVNVKELGQKVHLDSGTLTPLLKRLEGKGLVIRTRGEEDERVRIITLSEEGRNMQKQAEQVPTDMFCQSNMGVEELNALKQSCDLLLSRLAD